MRRPLLALALMAAIGYVLATGGCSAKKTTLGPDLPPETSVFIQGQVDTVSHRVHLYWFGTDPDGYVVAYLMRFVPTRGNPNPKWDTVYCAMPGRCTDSTFTLFTGDSSLIHTQFEIRAMDDKGLVDPTPAIQPLLLSNLAPVVHITNKYRWNPTNPGLISDSTFASATVSWTVDDPDGGGPGLRFRLWLNGNQAVYDSTTANTFTVPSARFLQGDRYFSGPRTLYLQAVDDGGSSGPPDSTTWFVRAPARRRDFSAPFQGRNLLVVDDSRSTADNNFGVDTLYANVLRRNLPDSCYAILRLEFSNPFRSAADVQQTLAQFDAVAWYRGYDQDNPSDYAASTALKNYQDVIGQYITGGGRVLLEGVYLIEGRNSFGALREDFVTRYLNSRAMVEQFSATFPDSTVGLSTPQSGLRLRSTLYSDAPLTMSALPVVQGISPGLRAFVVNDTSQVAFWSIQGQIANLDSTFYRGRLDVPVGISISQPPGRVILLGYPSRAMPSPANLALNKRPLARLLFGTSGLLAP